MRKTKIICTIGPSSENPEVFRAMCKQGLNVARLNFSHGTHEEHQKKIDMIKAVRAELKLPIAIMLDTTRRTTGNIFNDIDEELRILYVGVTRAKKNLFLIDSKSGQGYDRLLQTIKEDSHLEW